MDEEELANLDTEAIMIKQVEELENEKRQLIARLKSQEKKVDHLERAKRKEEIPLIKESMIQVSFSTFLFYVIFSSIFDYYHRLVFGALNA